MLRPGIRILGFLEKPFPIDSLRQLLARWQAGLVTTADPTTAIVEARPPARVSHVEEG